MSLNSILNDIQTAMLSSIEDGNGEGSWEIRPNFISVTTRFSRDPQRSNNGGEYYFYRRFKIVPGGIKAWDDWSADWDYADWGGTEDFYPIALSELNPIANLAEKRAIAQWNKQAQPACPCCGNPLTD